MQMKLTPHQTLKLYDALIATEIQQSRIEQSLENKNLSATRNATLLVEELETVGILVAIVSGIANALASKDTHAVRISDLAKFFPRDSAICMSAVRYLRKSGHEPVVVEQLDFYGVCIASAKQKTLEMLATDVEVQRYANDMGELAILWRRSCRALLNVLAALKRSLGDMSADPVSGAESELYAMLLESHAGGCPSMNAKGIPVYPNWAERRRNKRFKVEIPVQVQIDKGDWLDATLKDISISGMGLSGLAACNTGDEISIQLPLGQQFSGTVVWSSEGRVGVQLNEAQQTSDITSRSIIMRSRSK